MLLICSAVPTVPADAVLRLGGRTYQPCQHRRRDGHRASRRRDPGARTSRPGGPRRATAVSPVSSLDTRPDPTRGQTAGGSAVPAAGG